MKEIRRTGRKQVPGWFMIIMFLHGVPEIPHGTTQTSPYYVPGLATPRYKEGKLDTLP